MLKSRSKRMTMDRLSASSTGSNSPETKSNMVLAIECLKGSSKADEWNQNMLQTGDIVEELKIGNYLCVPSPFKSGTTGIQKLLRESYKRNETSIHVRVRRGQDEFIQLLACIVPNESSSGRKQYMLKSIDDPNYTVGFSDRTEEDCLAVQGSKSFRVETALRRAKLQDGYVGYPWEKKMQDLMPVANSSCFLSLLLLPKASDSGGAQYNDLEDTLSRANAWLAASQAHGVPIVFLNIQTESLLTKISGETASATVNAGSLSDLSNLANVSLYGFEDYHGVDIGVVRAVRLWYAPFGGELAVEIKLQETDLKLGFAISRTDEGFIYISSVIDGDDKEDGGPTPSTRSGLTYLYKEAQKASKLLIVSRVSNEKVLPWMVSSTGAIRCYDTISLSQKLSLHRHALRPILLHVFVWDPSLVSVSKIGKYNKPVTTAAPPPVMAIPPPQEIHLPQGPPQPTNDNKVHAEVASDVKVLQRDTAGEVSFRFNDFSVSTNWV
ncbi:hypothetical protein MKW92_022242 [Papaver armeniacum]|nr:hypothetical protein MKW92_022242 [Papaver armeniacum]